jgi:hypothetical protein
VTRRYGPKHGVRHGRHHGVNVFGDTAPPASRGTIVATNLETASSTVNATSFATGSVTLAANSLGLLWCVATTDGTITPTVTDSAGSWDVVTFAAVGVRRLALFRRLSASPITSAITISYGATVQASCGWSVVQCTGVDTSGSNGSGAVLQNDTSTDNTGAATTINATLAAFEDVTNAHLAGVALSIQSTVNPDPDFAELGDDNESANVLTIESQWALNQTTCDPTFLAANAIIVSVEVKSSPA